VLRRSGFRVGVSLAAWATMATLVTAATPNGFRAPGRGDRAAPGDVLEVSWELDLPPGDGKDEMELVLSLDGGATFPVRVTNRLEPGAVGLRWRIPALPTRNARLALRAGEDGEAEVILAVSDPFVIEAAGFRAPEPLYEISGEWRTGDALDGLPARGPAPDLRPDAAPDEIEPDDAAADDTDTPPASSTGPSTVDSGIAAARRPARREALAPTPTLHAPLPLRL